MGNQSRGKGRFRTAFFLPGMYANAQNGLCRKGIVLLRRSAPETRRRNQGIRGRNESAAHRFFSGSRYQENTMNKLRGLCKSPMWFVALLLAAVVAGCGGGGGGGVGSGGAGSGAAVLPGAAGTTGAAATDPTVRSASPSDGATNV